MLSAVRPRPQTLSCICSRALARYQRHFIRGSRMTWPRRASILQTMAWLCSTLIYSVKLSTSWIWALMQTHYVALATLAKAFRKQSGRTSQRYSPRYCCWSKQSNRHIRISTRRASCIWRIPTKTFCLTLQTSCHLSLSENLRVDWKKTVKRRRSSSNRRSLEGSTNHLLKSKFRDQAKRLCSSLWSSETALATKFLNQETTMRTPPKSFAFVWALWQRSARSKSKRLSSWSTTRSRIAWRCWKKLSEQSIIWLRSLLYPQIQIGNISSKCSSFKTSERVVKSCYQRSENQATKSRSIWSHRSKGSGKTMKRPWILTWRKGQHSSRF